MTLILNILYDEIGLSVGSVHTIMTERLSWRKVCAQWVSHSLQPQQEACRMAHCTDHLQRYAREGNEFLAWVVPGDESWCPLQTRIETTKSPVEASRATTTKKIQGHPHKCRKGYADARLWPRRPPSDRLPAAWDNSECSALLAKLDHHTPSNQIEMISQAHPGDHSAPQQCKASYGQHNHGTLAEIQVGGSRSPSIQSRSLSLWLCHFWSSKRLWGANDSPRTMTSRSMCRIGLQHSPGIFSR